MSESVDEFRARALAWLQENAAPAGSEQETERGRPVATLEEAKCFQKALYEAGFAGITWPKEYGGQGLSTEYFLAFTDVSKDFALPTSVFVIGLGMPAPTILELGSEEQKKRYIPKLLSGEEIWCQLFSEPSGGSDVAALTTTAVQTENGWVINGQKVWTTGAQVSDYGAIVARTDPSLPKHSGITMFIVDMHAPGVTVRPLKVATGHSPFNEVFFDGVEVPADAVIGQVNRGWDAAVVMLRNERVTIGASGRSRTNPLGYDSLLQAVKDHGYGVTETVAAKLAQVYARELALASYGRVLHQETLAGVPIGARGSAAKLAGAEQALWASDIAEQILGEALVLGEHDLEGIKNMIIAAPGGATAGGSNEIQRNIVAERVLGLPKDAGVDKNIPFNQLRVGTKAN